MDLNLLMVCITVIIVALFAAAVVARGLELRAKTKFVNQMQKQEKPTEKPTQNTLPMYKHSWSSKPEEDDLR